MKIAFISAMSGFPWGGSETLWSKSANHLLSLGHKVFASVKHWPERPEEVALLDQTGVEVDERKWMGADRSRKARIRAKILRKPIRDPGWEPSWGKIVDFAPDLVCISQGSTLCGIDWMIRCKQSGMPYASIVNANFEQWWPDDEQIERFSMAYRGSLMNYFVSKANRELFERQIAMKLENAEVISNPFNVSWNADTGWPEESGGYQLACVARLEPAAKGHDLLFQVLAQPKWKGRNLKVTLFGKGPWENSLKRLASFYGIDGMITFGGHVQDIENVWKAHHALVLPSRYEGLPLSMVEAMLCSRTVIVTDVAGNREPIVDNETGFVAAAATVIHLDEAMERAWNRRHEWEAMGKAAATSIRLRIPKDPAKEFADRLIALV